MSTNSTSKYIEELRKILKKCTSNTLWGHHNEFEILILYETDVKHIVELFKKQNLEINKKDKIIDLMAKKLNQAYFDEDKFELWFERMMGVQEKMDYGYVVDLIKQYYERKVEDGNKNSDNRI